MATNHIAMITVRLDGEEHELRLDLTGDEAQQLIEKSRHCMAMIYLSFRNDDDVRHLVTAALGGFHKAQITSLNGLVEDLDISRRSKNKLHHKKIVYVWQLCELSAVTVLRSGIGKIGLIEIEDALEKIGLELDMKSKFEPILHLIKNRSFDSEELVRELRRHL